MVEKAFFIHNRPVSSHVGQIDLLLEPLNRNIKENYIKKPSD